MRRFEPVDGVAALLDRDNIDTDQMLPAAFMRGVEPDYGAGLFALWRRDPSFVLSRPGWQDARVLVSGANFGCGSTREHATWALDEFGIRVLVAASFGEVFRDNCIKNGILPITLSTEPLEAVRGLLRETAEPVRLKVDLRAQTIAGPGLLLRFELPAPDKTALLDGLDEIGMTLQMADAITRWEGAADPWLQSMRGLP